VVLTEKNEQSRTSAEPYVATAPPVRRDAGKPERKRSMSMYGNLSPNTEVPVTGRYKCEGCGGGALAEVFSMIGGQVPFAGALGATQRAKQQTFRNFTKGERFTHCPNCMVPGSSSSFTGWTLVEAECEKCSGKGYLADCKTCQGTGRVGCDCDHGKTPCEECKSTGETKCHACAGAGKKTFLFGLLKPTCATCHGTGSVDHATCKGTGKLDHVKCKGKGDTQCAECSGRGRVDRCSACSGTGKISE
jgi:RecJ-like exonuclease